MLSTLRKYPHCDHLTHRPMLGDDSYYSFTAFPLTRALLYVLILVQRMLVHWVKCTTESGTYLLHRLLSAAHLLNTVAPRVNLVA